MPQPRFTVLVTDFAWPDLELEQAILAEASAELVAAPTGVEQELVLLAADADAIMTCWAQVTQRVIEAAPKLRIVARYGIGLDNIAVDVATARGIPVTYVPDYCVEEVSDHALALLLVCARKIAFFHHQTKEGDYNLKAGPPMRRLRGQTLGIVGLGRIARTLVPKAKGLGLRVIATTPSAGSYGLDVEMVSLDELLAGSDFVSLHLPSTEATHHLIGADQLATMKPTAYLINTARGALVDHAALAAALESEQIAGAALDVFDPEPPDLSTPLFRSPRLIATPHAAFWSTESLEELRRRTATQVADLLSGRRPENVVNPVVFDTGQRP